MIDMRGHIDQRKGLEKLASMCPGGVMVEVGCYAGASTAIFAQTQKFEVIHAVDQWQAGYDEQDITSKSVWGMA
jgi:predicted O-methyltransferase YrrM